MNQYFSEIARFGKEAWQELKLVSWLPRQQMIASTIVIIIFTLVMALYVSAIDRALLFFARILFGIG